MKRLYILTLSSVLMAAGIFFLKKKPATTLSAGSGLVLPKEWLVNDKGILTPSKDIRPGDQTFLTFPEWYLVFSPEEQANNFKKHTATTFPFVSHTAQIWESYHIVSDQVAGNFPANKGYHFMIYVIGTSASTEYLIKAWYETVAGRLTDTREVITEEDKFNAQFTQDYVEFIKDKPWYEFDFAKRLGALWQTSFSGGHIFRKIERRYWLTSELLVKVGYGKLIKMGTKTVYEDALPTTAVVVDKMPPASVGVSVIKQNDNGTVLLSLPRYNKFMLAACSLAKSGINFTEIAGNTSAILVSILCPFGYSAQYDNTKIVFTQPVASDASMKRVVLAVRIGGLSSLLTTLMQDRVSIEHVFDY